MGPTAYLGGIGAHGPGIDFNYFTSVGEPPVHHSVAPEAHRLRNRGRMRQPVARLDTWPDSTTRDMQ